MRDLDGRQRRRCSLIVLAVGAALPAMACDAEEATPLDDSVSTTTSTPASTPPASTRRSADPTSIASVDSSLPDQDSRSTTASTASTASTAATTAAAATTTTTLTLDFLSHPAGLELPVPTGWMVSATVIATEFAQGAECESTVVVDFEPPTDSGEAQAADALRSVVQVCARPADVASVEELLAMTYGGTGDFEQIEIDGEVAYRRGDATDSLAFVLHDHFTFQILTSVVADPTLEAQRVAEVERIFESIRFA